MTGRCADSALALAACLHAYDWQPDDWDRLAAGSLARIGPESTDVLLDLLDATTPATRATAAVALAAVGSQGEALLRARNLCKAFGDFQVVDDVSFDIDSGTITGLIGPNGAGKTTLFNLLCGFLKADSGSVELAGKASGGATPSVCWSATATGRGTGDPGTQIASITATCSRTRSRSCARRRDSTGASESSRRCGPSTSRISA